MADGFDDLPDWERLLAAEQHLQALVPGSVLVGRIAAALDGIMTGIRQLRRTGPLEVEVVDGLRVPTLPEMARIKAWLLATRHTVRDYLDTVVLLERLGDGGAHRAFAGFDELMRSRPARRRWPKSSSAFRAPRLRTRPRSSCARTRASYRRGTTGVTWRHAADTGPPCWPRPC